MSSPRVAIVGGGASGTLLAVQLLAQARQPLEVTLIEPDRVGRGVAYGTPHVEHLLNVPAGRMSALPDDADHFVSWLAQAREPADPALFAPRRSYGAYLQATLTLAAALARPGVLFHRVQDEAVAVGPQADGAVVLLRGGQTVLAHRVAIAIGNRPGPGPLPELAGRARYVADPWALGALDAIAPDHSVLVVGTGLTAVDVVLLLASRGHLGSILAVSRHGLLPAVHGGVAPLRLTPPRTPPTLRAWVRWARRQQEAAVSHDWRALVDVLRPLTPKLWQRLGDADRRRFLRHLRAFWDVQRHRMPPPVAMQLGELRRRGVLEVAAARVRTAVPGPDGFDVTLNARGTGAPRCVRASWIVNATGPESDPARSDSTLLRQLLRDGVARPDPLRLGLAATPAGALLDAHDRASDVFFTLGPLLRGLLWETTAVPEIRQQAQALARLWLAAQPTAEVAVSSRSA